MKEPIKFLAPGALSPELVKLLETAEATQDDFMRQLYAFGTAAFRIGSDGKIEIVPLSDLREEK